jgi:molybdopterin/thiamine biosynthesis adenylyltransferase
MSVTPGQFNRIASRLDIHLLSTKLVVVVGIGTVGSQIASELANDGVGRLRLIDDDRLEEGNLPRHALTRAYLGMNKAEALTLHLSDEVPTLKAKALPRKVDQSMSDKALDSLLRDADLIVAATDDRDAQRRIARRALALDIPAVLPALYGDSGGEVFVQRSSQHPCFFCWDGFRPQDERLRGVAAINAETLAVLQLAVQLCLGILDRNSEYAEFMVGPPHDRRPFQLFIQRRYAALERAPQRRRDECPLCNVGPAPGNTWTAPAPAATQAITVSPTPEYGAPSQTVAPPSDQEPWWVDKEESLWASSEGEPLILRLLGMLFAWFLWCLGVAAAVYVLFSIAGSSSENNLAAGILALVLDLVPVVVIIARLLNRVLRRR